jgi:lipopolysaccharide/colanic/teichoic acid biosynthesis glycosyltransferase
MSAHPAYRASPLDAAAPLAGGSALPVDLDPAVLATPNPTHDGAQRAMDLVLGIAVALCLLPAMLAIALVLAATVDGSLLLRERRVGRHGRVFEVLRFRTMGVGRYDRSGFARLVYLTRLDELPQLANVLRGDMSIVGPRPETPLTVRRLASCLRGYELRHLVKPGLTGWSQAIGRWSSRDEAARLSSDLFYVRNRSLALDLRILLHTAAVVLGGTARRGD